MFKPQYVINNKILTLALNIDVARYVIETAPLIPSWERKFQNEALIRQIHHSTAIEENSLDIDQVKDFLSHHPESARQRDFKEIINYRNAVNLMDKFGPQLSLEMVLQINKVLLHDIISANKTGKLRNSDVIIVNSRNNEVELEPPSSDEVPELIDELINWYNYDKETHPILKSGILQYMITFIHPFVEGNGRTARILSTWSLYTSGYRINRFFSLEEYYDKDVKGYYSALQSADESSDLTEWLAYYVEGLAHEFDKIRLKVQKMSPEVQKRNLIGQIAISERQIKIVNHIIEKGFFQNSDFSTLFPKVSDDTILRELKDLVVKKVIKKSGRTKGAKYFMR